MWRLNSNEKINEEAEEAKVMRKILICGLACFVICIMMTGVVVAKDGVKIALVDVEEVFTRFSETKKVNDYLQRAKGDRQKKLDLAQQELAKLKQDLESQEDGLSSLEKEQFRGTLEEKFLILKQDYERYEMELKNLQKKKLKELEMKILDAIKAVGKKSGFDLILERDAVYLGGEDITDIVLEYMNKEFETE